MASSSRCARGSSRSRSRLVLGSPRLGASPERCAAPARPAPRPTDAAAERARPTGASPSGGPCAACPSTRSRRPRRRSCARSGASRSRRFPRAGAPTPRRRAATGRCRRPSLPGQLGRQRRRARPSCARPRQRRGRGTDAAARLRMAARAEAAGSARCAGTPQVLRYLDYFKNDPKGHAVMANWLRRAGRYRELFEKVLARQGLPRDLFYVAMVESGFDTRRALARRRRAASGSSCPAPRAPTAWRSATGSTHAAIPSARSTRRPATSRISTSGSDPGTWCSPPTTPATARCCARSPTTTPTTTGS